MKEEIDNYISKVHNNYGIDRNNLKLIGFKEELVMEKLNKMYIVKLLSCSARQTSSFLAKDENNNIYGASIYFYRLYQNIFNYFEENKNEKFAVIVDEIGSSGKWKGYHFRSIQFISSSREFCEKFKLLKFREEEIILKSRRLLGVLLEKVKSNQDPNKTYNLNEEREILEEKLSIIKKNLEELNYNNY